MAAGRRFGKSEIGGHDLLLEAFVAYHRRAELRDMAKRMEFWVVGPNYCTDELTRALTRNGWAAYDTLSVGDEIMTLNTESGLSEWQPIRAMNVFDNGPQKMLSMKQRGHDSLTTAQHKWPIAWYGNRSKNNVVWREKRGYRFGFSGIEAHVNEMIESAAPCADVPIDAAYDDALVELVAWYMTEGCRRNATSGCGIAQLPGVNNNRIIAACEKLFGPEAPMKRQYEAQPKWRALPQGGVYLNCAAANIICEFAPAPHKAVTLDFIHSLTMTQLDNFVLTALRGDYLAKTDSIDSTCFMQKERTRLDAVQMACTLLGYKTTMTKTRLWNLFIYRRKGGMIMRTAQRNGEWIDYDGPVWCPTTGNGTWLAERNGTVYFTGNSDSEKEFRILWNRCKQQEMPFDKPGTYNDPIGGNMHISLWGGLFQVHAKSGAHPESLVGEGLHGVVVAEAAKLKEKVWTKYVRPTLNDFSGWAELTSTPEGKNWFYDAWQRGQDPNQVAWESWRRPAWMNPYVYKGGASDEQVAEIRRLLNARLPVTPEVIHHVGIDPEVAQLMMDLTEPMFKQEIAADFTEFVGRVFYDFDEETHVGDFQYDPSWTTYAAVDYGFTNPNVWLLLQVDPFNERVRVLDEVYERGLTPEEFAREIKRRGLCPADIKTFYPDPASPGDSRLLEQHLGVRSSGGTGGEIKHRIDAIRKALQVRNPHLDDGHPDRVPTLQFDRKCTYTIRDMLEYRYPDRRDEQDRNAPELPMKKDDHGPEALGRFFAGHYGTPAQRARRAKVRRASMSG